MGRPPAAPQVRQGLRALHDLRVDGDQFTWRCDDDGEQERFFGRGSAPIVGEDGNLYEVKVALNESAIAMTSDGASGGERAVFRPADSGTMVVSKAMYSPHMPDEVSWTMKYRRVE